MKNIISFNVLKGQYHFNNNRDYFFSESGKLGRNRK